ncbi:immediate early response 2b [Triplophysa rosa]|uniref:Immediate early response gene 2 protein n=1 Tax=Triplophysa rosa TaxID=992332 RepID=A0A9W7WDE9_TRIRA|nr:immediate early response 2b [Triplophysa rosa]KAI7795105.1 putative immediate early response gene 2 protein [Triplophysa rosa]
MDVEARRIMALSISKLYSSRTQRGGLRLHRSLLLSMTMRAARDIYHAAVEQEQVVPCAPEEPMDTKEQDTVNDSLKEVNTREPKDNLEEDKENQDSKSRKRRVKTAIEPDFLPPKKARMDTDEERQEVLKPNNGNGCRQTETLTAFPTNRAIVAC